MSESDDLRQFMREITMRHERIWREQVTEIRRQLDELRALRERNDAAHAVQIEQLRELREEDRAQRQALLHILGRLDNGGAAA